MDDILVAGNKGDTHEICTQLSREYEIKNLGLVNQYLDIIITRTVNGNFELDQEHKIIEIAERFNLSLSKPTYTSMCINYFSLDPDGTLLDNNKNYRQTIGRLLYIATLTRPEISVAVNILKRGYESP